MTQDQLVEEAIQLAFFHIARNLEIEQGDLDPLTSYQLRQIFVRWIKLNSKERKNDY